MFDEYEDEYECEDEDDLESLYADAMEELEEEECRQSAAIAACERPYGKYRVYMPIFTRTYCTSHPDFVDVPF